MKPLDVFISSTCYDLTDLRFELKAYLEQNGCTVRISEDPMCPFLVDPMSPNSIACCLANVEASDVVVCVLDRRYGGVIDAGEWEGKSATEAEVLFAREKSRPVFFFMRELARLDYEQLCRDRDYQSKWVEPKNNDQRERWLEFARYIRELPEHSDRSNWCDQFQTIVDLRPRVLKRLVDKFPAKAISVAMRPERLVRMTFRWDWMNLRHQSVAGWFKNIGPGAALNLTHGWSVEPLGIGWSEPLGALGEGEQISGEKGLPRFYESGSVQRVFVFCEYENR